MVTETRCESWHRLGERCNACGRITCPARFYIRAFKDGKVIENTQVEAEGVYLEWLRENMPGHPLARPENTPVRKLTDGISGRGRPRKWASEAERKRASRKPTTRT